MPKNRSHWIYLVLEPDESRLVQELLENALDAETRGSGRFPRPPVEAIYRKLADSIERVRRKGGFPSPKSGGA